MRTGLTDGAARRGRVDPKDLVPASLGGFVKEDHTTRVVTMIMTEPDCRTQRDWYNNADSSIGQRATCNHQTSQLDTFWLSERKLQIDGMNRSDTEYCIELLPY
jgi:hypothetical protein